MPKIKALSRLVDALRTPSTSAASGQSEQPARLRRGSAHSGDSHFEALSKTSFRKRVSNAVSRSPAGEPSGDAYLDFMHGAKFSKSSKAAAKPPESSTKESAMKRPKSPTEKPVEPELPPIVSLSHLRLPVPQRKQPLFTPGLASQGSSTASSLTAHIEAPPERRPSSGPPGSEISSE